MDEVQEIKEKIDIVEVISSYLTLKKAGVNWKAKCPFHNEKSPSMMISAERQSFKCFGCGEGGDVFTFIEKIEGIDFYNTLKLLSERAGVQLKTKQISYAGREHTSDNKTRSFEMNEWAKKLYHKVLIDHPKAEKSREYLSNRGLSLDTIKSFELGYAPKSWDFLIKFLKSKGYQEKEMSSAGLVIQNEKGSHYDRFRGRIMFPINNIMGNTIAFTSRILEDEGEQAKYINSSESPIYVKGKTIYGLDKAKMAIKEKDLAIFVEGNMDVIACHQSGFKNVVATSGTALTADQLKILTRYASTIAFSFDSDNAGQIAFKKAVELSIKNDISSKIISIPFPYKDPDEVIKKNPELWQKAVDEAKPAVEYWIDCLVKKTPDLNTIDKKKIAKEILPVIKLVYSDIEKECDLKYLSKRLMVSEKSLLAALEKTVDQGKETVKETLDKPKLNFEQKIMGILWLTPQLIEKIDPSLIEFIADENNKSSLEKLLKGSNKESFAPGIACEYDQYALMTFEEYNTQDPELLFSELQFLLGRLKSDKREELREEFAKKIREAEMMNDKNRLKELLVEFSTLIK